MNKIILPETISRIAKTLKENGYSAYLVGGCVRDLLVSVSPKDWDFTTDAGPEEIEKCFENTFTNNPYGTVTVVNQNEEKSLQGVEITPYRSEGEYLDGRRPESVKFVKTLKEDLSRRDFTINAIAIDPEDFSITDPFDGLSELQIFTISSRILSEEIFCIFSAFFSIAFLVFSSIEKFKTQLNLTARSMRR